MPRQKLSTDSIVKNLFEHLKEAPSPPQAPSIAVQENVFFRRTEPAAAPAGMIQAKAGFQARKIFFWIFLSVFLFLSTQVLLSYLEKEASLRQSQSFLALRREELVFWEGKFTERKKQARDLRYGIRKIQARQKKLAGNLLFLERNLKPPRQAAGNLLLEICRKRPVQVFLQELSFYGPRLSLKGFASDARLLLGFFRDLRTVPALKNIEISVQSPRGPADFFYLFKLRSRIHA